MTNSSAIHLYVITSTFCYVLILLISAHFHTRINAVNLVGISLTQVNLALMRGKFRGKISVKMKSNRLNWLVLKVWLR